MRIVALIAAGAPAAPPALAAERPPAVETIRYETSACYGFCPDYVVTVSSDGRGLFEGRGDTRVRGRRAFAVTPAQFAAFRERLEPVRPKGDVLIEPGKPPCGDAATDQITIGVRWRRAGTPDRRLSFYFGCGMNQHAALRAALIAAPKVLPIAAFIGTPATSR